MVRYDTRCYFNVRSKADISQLNLPHGNDLYRSQVSWFKVETDRQTNTTDLIRSFMPLTVILIIISFPSPILSFIPDLNLPFLQILPTAAFLFLLQD